MLTAGQHARSTSNYHLSTQSIKDTWRLPLPPLTPAITHLFISLHSICSGSSAMQVKRLKCLRGELDDTLHFIAPPWVICWNVATLENNPVFVVVDVFGAALFTSHMVTNLKRSQNLLAAYLVWLHKCCLICLHISFIQFHVNLKCTRTHLQRANIYNFPIQDL